MLRIKRQVLAFGIVGAINTAVDFIILNILRIVFGMPHIPANIISTTTAMLLSFFANKRVVFGSDTKSHTREIVLFFLFTIFGLYIIQNGIILVLVEASDWPGDMLVSILKVIRLDGIFSRDFALTNTAKLIATIASMTWNYFTYKKYVFKSSGEQI